MKCTTLKFITLLLAAVVCATGLAIVLSGCENKRRSRSNVPIAGVLNMGGVPGGWGVKAVPVGHPQILIDPQGRWMVKSKDVKKFVEFNGGMTLSEERWYDAGWGGGWYEGVWELQPFDDNYHQLTRTEELGPMPPAKD